LIETCSPLSPCHPFRRAVLHSMGILFFLPFFSSPVPPASPVRTVHFFPPRVFSFFSLASELWLRRPPSPVVVSLGLWARVYTLCLVLSLFFPPWMNSHFPRNLLCYIFYRPLLSSPPFFNPEFMPLAPLFPTPSFIRLLIPRVPYFSTLLDRIFCFWFSALSPFPLTHDDLNFLLYLAPFTTPSGPSQRPLALCPASLHF